MAIIDPKNRLGLALVVVSVVAAVAIAARIESPGDLVSFLGLGGGGELAGEPSERPAPPLGGIEPVSPADIGITVGASGMVRAIHGDVDLTTDREFLENVTINGCVTVNADEVTIRNVLINCPDSYPIKDNASDGTRVENVTIDCLDNATKGIYFFQASNFVVDHVEITRCDDQFFIDGGLGNSSISNSVFHNQAPSSAAHTDGMQIGEFEVTTGTLTVGSNWWEYNREGCCENAVLFLSNFSALTVNIVNNYLDGHFGTHLIRCHGSSNCLVEDNQLGSAPDGLFILHESEGVSVARCNTWIDGGLIDQSYYHGLTPNDQAC